MGLRAVSSKIWLAALDGSLAPARRWICRRRSPSDVGRRTPFAPDNFGPIIGQRRRCLAPVRSMPRLNGEVRRLRHTRVQPPRNADRLARSTICVGRPSNCLGGSLLWTLGAWSCHRPGDRAENLRCRMRGACPQQVDGVERRFVNCGVEIF